MKYRKYAWHILFVLLICVLQAGRAQTIDVQTAMDTNAIRLGEQTVLSVIVKAEEGKQIRMPFKEYATNHPIEILDQSSVDTIVENGNIYLRTSLNITSFDSGSHRLPLVIMIENGTQIDLDTILAPNLEVALVEVDTAQVFMPIKRQLSAPIRTSTILNWLIGSLLLIGIAIGIYMYFFKKGKGGEEPIELVPPRPAYEIALEELDQLNDQKLWQTGKVKPYYIKLTDIIRIYLERQFKLPAMESTTDEIMDGVRKTDIADRAKMNLRELLELSDLVKFAKMKPNMDDHTKSINYARDFVLNTKPSEEEATEKDMTSITAQAEQDKNPSVQNS